MLQRQQACRQTDGDRIRTIRLATGDQRRATSHSTPHTVVSSLAIQQCNAPAPTRYVRRTYNEYCLYLVLLLHQLSHQYGYEVLLYPGTRTYDEHCDMKGQFRGQSKNYVYHEPATKLKASTGGEKGRHLSSHLIQNIVEGKTSNKPSRTMPGMIPGTRAALDRRSKSHQQK